MAICKVIGGCRPKGVATGAGGGGGTCPPQKNSRCPPRCPPPSTNSLVPPRVPPPTKKNHAYIFFKLPISRGCKYFAPHKNHAYAFLKYALKCLFVNGCSSRPIHIERNSTFIKMPKFSKLARSARSRIHRFSQC